MELVVLVADGPWSRLLGLAFLDEPPRGGLLLERCEGVHTFGMRFAVDVVFLDRDSLLVCDVVSHLRPRRSASLNRPLRPQGRGSVAALELEAGRAAAAGIVPLGCLAPAQG